jgi:hypothetical protein
MMSILTLYDKICLKTLVRISLYYVRVTKAISLYNIQRACELSNFYYQNIRIITLTACYREWKPDVVNIDHVTRILQPIFFFFLGFLLKKLLSCSIHIARVTLVHHGRQHCISAVCFHLSPGP